MILPARSVERQVQWLEQDGTPPARPRFADLTSKRPVVAHVNLLKRPHGVNSLVRPAISRMKNCHATTHSPRRPSRVRAPRPCVAARPHDRAGSSAHLVRSRVERLRPARRTISTFSCDIAYSDSPTASRASALVGEAHGSE